MKIVLIVMAILFILCIILFWRRRWAMCKVCGMTPFQKLQKINEIANEFGYCYEPSQDIFLTRINAWQRKFGYEWLYDKVAARFNMVYDCFPVYFDYNGKSWLIEFWKGQYGISVGSEIGVYNVDYIVPEEKRMLTHYQAVGDDELLNMAFALYEEGVCSYTWGQRHWWLAAFRPGTYQEPSRLRLWLRIIFPDVAMARAFVDGLKQADYEIIGLERNCSVVMVSVAEKKSPKTGCCPRLQCVYSQWKNKCSVALYHFVTRPFCKTMDKLLFLYYQLPICVRRLFCIKRFGCKEKRKMRCWNRKRGRYTYIR